MKLNTLKRLIFPALFALAAFLTFSLGGEFVHKSIHHHASQAEHDACPVFLLSAQSFTFDAHAPLVLMAAFVLFIAVPSSLVPSRPCLGLPPLRAPPVSR